MLVLLPRLLDRSKAGHARTVRHLILWLLILIVSFLVFCHKYVRVTENYTDLHRRVTRLERFHD